MNFIPLNAFPILLHNGTIENYSEKQEALWKDIVNISFLTWLALALSVTCGQRASHDGSPQRVSSAPDITPLLYTGARMEKQ